ncbi:hypothetical protein DL766_010562 [Monosporascus sp. MC13-8B]|uniref:DUF6590 domain-containing protein n=1 Tax=Monosporascus cannonballus TaxID=155416 RepID=A0ABY0H7S4_9PEZI|nr:hypothetical protein DL762_005586 [Monosporascus cannonballus]RYP00146.1 hypothetical protein DL763_001075 [Monosporascus cannonballus]RYP02069.1 hypothetical protein DL766_010562 [Monosporascus sp. MC13-8B]
MGKGNSHASSSSHNNWSDPIWSEAYQQWYTQRVGRDGKTEFNWIRALPPAAAGQDDAIPRSQQHVDQITQGVQDMNIAQAAYGGGQQYTHQIQQVGGHSSTIDPSQSHLPADSIGDSNSFSPSIYTHHGVVEIDPPIGEGKGKARADDQQHMDSGVALMQGDVHPIDPGFGLSGGGYGGGGEQFGGLYDTVAGNAPVDGGFDQVAAESHSQNFGQAHPGEASLYNTEPTAYDQPTIDPNTYSHGLFKRFYSVRLGANDEQQKMRKKRKHKRPPRPLKREPELGFEPVAVEIYADNEKLQLESRVNYSKLVTIEHNVKVFFIGKVAQQHLDYKDNSTPAQQAG